LGSASSYNDVLLSPLLPPALLLGAAMSTSLLIRASPRAALLALAGLVAAYAIAGREKLRAGHSVHPGITSLDTSVAAAAAAAATLDAAAAAAVVTGAAAAFTAADCAPASQCDYGLAPRCDDPAAPWPKTKPLRSRRAQGAQALPRRLSELEYVATLGVGTFATVRLVAFTPPPQDRGAERSPASPTVFAPEEQNEEQRLPVESARRPAAGAGPSARPRPFALKTLFKEKLVRYEQIEHTTTRPSCSPR
jgi:hypothetical protein